MEKWGWLLELFIVLAPIPARVGESLRSMAEAEDTREGQARRDLMWTVAMAAAGTVFFALIGIPLCWVFSAQMEVPFPDELTAWLGVLAGDCVATALFTLPLWALVGVFLARWRKSQTWESPQDSV